MFNLLKANPTEMVVTWVTETKEPDSRVEYSRVDQTTKSVSYANSNHFTDGGRVDQHIHRAIMTGLQPGQSYSMIINILFRVQ